MAKRIDWAKRGEAKEHPLRKRILERMLNGEKVSPVMLRAEFGEDIGNVAYHMRSLAEDGMVRLTHTQPVRGSVEHFYVIAKEAICYTNGHGRAASSKAGSKA